ncbi:glycosyltransferase family 4 protein [Synechococcus sp. HK05]|uniref:glycosyltransferase family 4 protein n=1 Tax=Synechococcus sp. HK05 TaxID=2725975 RepID=UPI001C391C23|nr:glycosyltransferase family 4 protein [Synechococcus sp. HK05]MBV2352136.1 glycosyltransferase family 4 protein [Synechococcus sp. HK05]
MPTSRLALFHPPGHLRQPDNPFGKDVANAGLFRALASFGGYERLSILNQVGLTPDALSQAWFPDVDNHPALDSAPLHDTQWPAQAGVLLRGQPYLAELAWLRCQAALQRDYSLVGLIHTLAPPAVRELIGSAALAPIEPWDALICTSPAVQRAMHQLFDQYEHYLADRLGASRFCRPQLPLIPLAVDVDGIHASASNRALGQAFRASHGISEDALVVLWVGRLSFYEKAFPQPMFLALNQAAQAVEQLVHFVMAGWFPGGEQDQRLYEQAAAAYAPAVQLHLLNGNDPAVVQACWSAADVFFSLVDNIQETFGLTPVEAMAAGLPIVASEWDGYAYTIRHEKDGFLVPTLGGAAPGLDALLANLHALGMETYQTYVGATAQHTAVDVPQAAAALTRLLASADLRRSMGASARERARSAFSWPVVVEHYNQLFDHLAAVRRDASTPGSCLSPQSHPVRGLPFRDFEGFATQVLSPQHHVVVADGIDLQQAAERLSTVVLDRQFPGLRAQPREVERLVSELVRQPRQSVAELQAHFPSERSEHIALTLVWLAKLGIVACGPPPPASH